MVFKYNIGKTWGGDAKMPNSKQQILLEQAQQRFSEMIEIIESVPARKRTLNVESDYLEKNFRDVLMHLYEWHAMLERWYGEGMDGDTPTMPAPGYKWRNLQQLNTKIHENNQDISLSAAQKKLTLSHHRVLKLIEVHTDEELFTKNYYKWTKTSNLYSYFAANTVNHYEWAKKRCTLIKQKIMLSVK